jgi:hypothetical protein
MDTYAITLTLTKPLLGSAPSDPEIYRSFIASKKLKEAKKRATAQGNSAEVTKLDEQEQQLAEKHRALAR